MSRTTHARSKKSIAPFVDTRGLALLRVWMRKRTTMDLARILRRSWTYTQRLIDGHVRPDPGEVYTLRREAGIPFDAWVMKSERLARTVAA